MTAFDLFQQATCEIGCGDRAAAIKTLNAALDLCAKGDPDADLAPDLRKLRDTCAARAA